MSPPRLLTHNGKTQSIADWARETGISYRTLQFRLRSKWPLEKALSKAVCHNHPAGADHPWKKSYTGILIRMHGRG